MTTVGDVIERLLRTYLEPADAQPAVALLSATIDETATQFIISAFVVPEDETLMASGVVVEMGSELIFVGNYDDVTSTASALERGFQGTTPATHLGGSRVILSPTYSRLSIFEAVADNILTLSPDLFTVRSKETSTVNGFVAALDDPLAVSVIEVFADGSVSGEVQGRVVDYHPDVGTRAVVLNRPAGQITIRYRRRMGVAEAESDTLEDLGVEDRWVNAVMAGAAADLFAGRDLPASQTAWINGALEAASIRVGTRASLSTSLARYRELLVDRARLEMRNEYRPQVRMRNIVESATGWR